MRYLIYIIRRSSSSSLTNERGHQYFSMYSSFEWPQSIIYCTRLMCSLKFQTIRLCSIRCPGRLCVQFFLFLSMSYFPRGDQVEPLALKGRWCFGTKISLQFPSKARNSPMKKVKILKNVVFWNKRWWVLVKNDFFL